MYASALPNKNAHALPPQIQASAGFIRSYTKGELVFSGGDEVTGLWVVVCGLVRLVHLTEEGSEITVRLAGPGDVLEPNFFGPSVRHSTDAVCVSERTILEYVPRQECSSGMDCKVPLDLFIQVARQFMLSETYTVLSLYPVKTRVAWLFVWLSSRFSLPYEGNWTEIELFLTHKDVATFVNAARSTVSAACGQLRREELLTSSQGRYFVRTSLQSYLPDSLSPTLKN